MTASGQPLWHGRFAGGPSDALLAYTVSLVGVPEIFVLDVATGKTQEIALGFGPLHWSSTSDKLYFYRKLERPDPLGDCLWVAEFEKAATPKSVPKPAPATQPAKP